MVNRKAVGPDGLPANAWKVLDDEGDMNVFTLIKLYYIIVAV